MNPLLSTTPPPPSFDQPHDDWELNVSLFGRFEGVNLPSSRYEGLMLGHIKRPHFEDAEYIYEHRWWDYRRLPIGHSFMLFNRCYLHAMRQGARNFIDSRGPQRGKNGQIMTRAQIASFNRLYGAVFTKQEEGDLWERDTRYIVGMFKAMTAADMFGVPYDQFCTITIGVALDKNWKRVPQPMHLYSDNLCADGINTWLARTSHRFQGARHPIYDLANYQGFPLQDAYHEWLIEQIDRREDDLAIPLSIALFDKPQLPLALAEKHYAPHMIARARSLAA